jgi:hypothetical protein
VSQFNFDVDVKASMTALEPCKLIKKAMSYDSAKTFTKGDWLFATQMWANLGWNIKQAEQSLEQLLQ